MRGFITTWLDLDFHPFLHKKDLYVGPVRLMWSVRCFVTPVNSINVIVSMAHTDKSAHSFNWRIYWVVCIGASLLNNLRLG